MSDSIRLGVWSVDQKEAISAIVGRVGLPIAIHDPAIAPNGEPVKYAIHLVARCSADRLWPFWEAMREAGIVGRADGVAA